MSEHPLKRLSQKWRASEPDRIIGRGHPVGDLLEAYEWKLLQGEPGRLRVQAHLPDCVRNPRDEMFGGFTATYADLFALFVFASTRKPNQPWRWLMTANLRVDYFAPIRGPLFELQGQLIHRAGRSGLVEVRFLDSEGRLCAMALVTMVEEKGREQRQENGQDQRGEKDRTNEKEDV